MHLPEIHYCPGTLAPGFDTYSPTCLKRVFAGKKVYHVLPYDSPAANPDTDTLYQQNQQRMSISGVQEKFSLLLEKNKLRLAASGERGTYILKPIPRAGKRPDQMPANEHLTMQIARQVYGIETAENALVFFKNGAPAYITKRFDVKSDGSKLAQDDFASLAQRTPQTYGEHYKYSGNYSELFALMEKYLPVYKLKAPKLLTLLLFNYLFSNGDAHLKNFSITETPMGDYRLSPAYDLLNTRVHIQDNDFALEGGLLPRSMAAGNIAAQFFTLSRQAAIQKKVFQGIRTMILSKSDEVQKRVAASYLDDHTKRNYWQSYQDRLKQLQKEFAAIY